MDNAKQFFKAAGHSLITWEWTKRLLHWIILSAGTMSECVFLIASLWVSINANVHTFVLNFISEQTSIFITQLCTTAFIALPECILPLAIVVTISHLRKWLSSKDFQPGIWTVLYFMPTLVFLLLSLITLGCSVANVTFTMPTPLVVTRALAGYIFALTSLLYSQLNTRDVDTKTVTTEETKSDTPEPEILPVTETEKETIPTQETIQEETTEYISEDTNNVIKFPFQQQKDDTTEETNTPDAVQADKDTKKETKIRGDKAAKAARYIRRNPGITPVELAKKADISIPYARRLLQPKNA